MGERARWDIKNGIYYENGAPCQIVYRFHGGGTVSLTKMSKEEGDNFKKQTED